MVAWAVLALVLAHSPGLDVVPILKLSGGATSRYYPSKLTKSMVEPRTKMSDAERIFIKQQMQRPEIRKKFLARVFTVVASQIFLTTLIMTAMRAAPALALQLVPFAPTLVFVALIPAFAISLIPDLAQRSFLGPLLLSLFTLLTSLGISASTLRLPAQLLLHAGVATLAGTAGLAHYAASTRRDFTTKRAMIQTGLLTLLAMGILQVFIGGSWMVSLRSLLGALVFSAYLVHDVQVIAGGGKAYQLGPDQYIVGALMVYQDILNLFLTTLQAMARADRER